MSTQGKQAHHNVTVGRVLLFDRPNPAEHILAGRIILDDGSVFAVGELLADAKTPFEVRFPPRPARWLLFVVTEVTPTTGWTGLAEIAVYEGDEDVKTVKRRANAGPRNLIQ